MTNDFTALCERDHYIWTTGVRVVTIHSKVKNADNFNVV